MTAPHAAGADRGADVVVIGAGLVGLATAAALADRGAHVILLADVRRGEASPAAAGMLAPSVEPAGGAAHRFAVAARDRYPAYLAALRERTGVDVPLNRLGVLQIALTEAEADSLRAGAVAPSCWLDQPTLAALEPGLAHAAGALHHPDDGALNNLALMGALKTRIGHDRRVRVLADAAEELTAIDARATVRTRGGATISSPTVVLAAGAWAASLDGLPRPLPIEPVRGQMMSVASRLLRHVAIGGGGYAVPRPDGRTILGGTVEHVGFDAAHTERGVAEVRRVTSALAPQLAGARMLNAWAGLRPVTPDGLPVIGRDPAQPSLIYACGHSRNGVLLAALTGEVVAALVAGAEPAYDLRAFAVERFGDAPAQYR